MVMGPFLKSGFLIFDFCWLCMHFLIYIDHELSCVCHFENKFNIRLSNTELSLCSNF